MNISQKMIRRNLIRIKQLLIPAGSSTVSAAQLKLFYLMLGANVFKGAIYLSDALNRHQGVGSGRAIRLIVISMLLIVALRMFPKYIKAGIFFAIIATILHIYYRVFNQNVGADVVALQAIVMVIISSFYGLNARWGIVFTVIASAAPVLSNYIDFRWTALAPLPTGLNDIYMSINFMVILLSHVYFHGVLFGSLKAKDRLNDALKKAADSKTAFLSTMAHELRTPLNSVIGIANLLVEENKNQKEREHLDVLKFSANNLLSLVNDILDINKLASGELELASIPFNCHVLLSSVYSSMTAQVKEKSLSLQLHLDPQIKDVIYQGDATRLSQVLFNLIGNAIKFTEKGSVTIVLELMDEGKNGDLIRFKIIDTGIGIDPGKQLLIFEPFKQASVNTAGKFGGTGLGLSIVKQLVEMFGSKVHLESSLGLGTTIYFDLLLKRSSAGLPIPEPAVGEEEIPITGLRILLAEDNIMNIYFMQHLLNRWDVKLDVAKNGEQAVLLHMERNYDVILMDVNMPIMDGLEATSQIRKLDDLAVSEVHIIALTAEMSEEVKAKLVAHGMNDYLPKPFQLEALRSKLKKLAARAKLIKNV